MGCGAAYNPGTSAAPKPRADIPAWRKHFGVLAEMESLGPSDVEQAKRQALARISRLKSELGHAQDEFCRLYGMKELRPATDLSQIAWRACPPKDWFLGI